MKPKSIMHVFCMGLFITAFSVSVAVGGYVPPIAFAGPDQTVYAGDLLNLYGSGTGTEPLSYQWILSVAMEVTGEINEQNAFGSFEIPIDVSGTIIARLWIYDLWDGIAWDDCVITVIAVTPPIGSICGTVIRNDGLGLAGISVSVVDANQLPVGAPALTADDGSYNFPDIYEGTYGVTIVTPLGYAVAPGETQTISVAGGGACTQADFVLTATVIANNCRGVGYWRHQFDAALTGRGQLQEPEAMLPEYLGQVQEHFDVLGVYTGEDRFTVTYAMMILGRHGNMPMADRARQHLFALLLNFASGRIGNETVVSLDGRVAAEAVTFAAYLLNDGDPANDELAKTICDLINNGQFIAAGIITESAVRYKIGLNSPLPGEIAFSQNYPNPFNAQTIIEYSLSEPSMVTVDIFDILGRRIVRLVDGIMPAGKNQASWDASGQPSGIYFYRIKAGDKDETRKIVLLK